MRDTTADDYRSRSSGEITDEQKELARLRVLSMGDGVACWEWDGENFIVSPAWVQMTGYTAAEMFPVEMSQVQPAFLVSALVAKLSAFVVESERGDFRSGLEVSLYATDSRFEDGVTFSCKDGSKKILLLIVATVWQRGQLSTIFATAKDISEYAGQPTAAMQIEKNNSKIGQNQEHIEGLEESYASLRKAYERGAKAAPLIVGLVGAIATAGEPFVKMFRSTTRRLTDNPVVVKIESQTGQAFLDSLSPDVYLQLEAILGKLAKDAKLVELAVYDPPYTGEPYPTRYTVFLEASFDDVDRILGDITNVNANANTASRANMHTAGGFYRYLKDDRYRLSRPFSVRGPSGRNHLFFIERQTKGYPTEGDEAQVKAAADAAKQVLGEAAANAQQQ